MIDDEGMVRLQRVATDLRLVPAESNEALARKALSLIASAREHRNQAARERHHALLARVEAGEKLSPGELEEMTILSDVLAMEH